MPLSGSSHVGSAFTQANLDKFIPELWTSEIIRARNSNLRMMDAVRRIPDSMKRGDVLHVPSVGRLAVNVKFPEQPVQLQNGTPGEFTMTVDRYIESSFMLEDIALIQSDYDARSIYTEEAGLALARDIDAWVLGHRVVLKAQGQLVTAKDASNNDTTLNRSAILTARLLLEQADVPLDDVVLYVSPAQYTSLLQIDQFVNTFYVNDRPTVTGRVGSIYGIPVEVTNAIKKNATTGFRIGDSDVVGPTPGVAFWNNTTASYSRYYPDASKTATQWGARNGGQHTLTAPTSTAAGDTLRVGYYSALLCSKDWFALWMQQEPKLESSREVLFQADAVVATQLYGGKVYRKECGVVIESNEAS